MVCVIKKQDNVCAKHFGCRTWYKSILVMETLIAVRYLSRSNISSKFILIHKLTPRIINYISFRLEYSVCDNSIAIVSRMLGRSHLGARVLMPEDMRWQKTVSSPQEETSTLFLAATRSGRRQQHVYALLSFHSITWCPNWYYLSFLSDTELSFLFVTIIVTEYSIPTNSQRAITTCSFHSQ